MLLQSEDIIDQPADIVYPLVRDEMHKIIPYLPNIESIKMISREDLDGNRVKIVNHWMAKAQIPSMLKKFARPELFSWKDYAVWRDDDYCVDFELESFLANDLYDAKGTNYFGPAGEGKTKLRVTCELIIHPNKIPGVPTFLAKKVLPSIESLLRSTMEPNLTSLGKGLTEYFKAQGK